MRPPMRQPRPLLRLAGVLLSLPFLGSCHLPGINTWQEKEGPTDEQLLELYTTTATYLYEDDSLVRAQDQAVKALEIEPDNLAMRRMIGWIRLRMGTNEDLLMAEDFFRTLRDEGDENHATTLGLATTLERLGVAYEQTSRLIANGERPPAEGEDAEVEASDLANLAQDLWNEAIELYDETLTNGEGSTNAMNGLQRVYALTSEYEKSLTWSEQLLERSGAEREAWERMLTHAELTEAEETLFRENVRIATRLQIDTHVFASTILYRLERYDEALEHLDFVIEAVPLLPQSYSLRAQVYIAQGNLEEAILDLDHYLRLSDEPFEHPDVRRAFTLRTECEQQLAQAD
jgi:tetratricopeptide (TPR) repeat protein